jgi:hypothetical protein
MRPQSKESGYLFMRTAIIKTDIWKDKKLRSMHIDTKLFYFCLITNPDRNTTRFFKVDEDYLCIQSGLDYRQLDVVKKQLEELELVYFKDDWVILSDNAFVAPAKGKLSQIIHSKDLASVPQEIINYRSKKLLSRTGAAQEYKDKDKDKDNNKDKDKNNSNTEINDIFSLWEETVGYKIESNQQKNRYACSNLLKKTW